MNLRPDFDSYFLDGSRWVATRADCVRRQVGAIIVDTERRIVSAGYNGSPAGQPGCLSDGACPRAFSDVVPGSHYGNCIAVHAEANAIVYADHERCRGGTMYVSHEPCHECTRLIAATGIARVVFYDQDDNMVIRGVPHLVV